jgi:hypothetical protein
MLRVREVSARQVLQLRPDPPMLSSCSAVSWQRRQGQGPGRGVVWNAGVREELANRENRATKLFASYQSHAHAHTHAQAHTRARARAHTHTHTHKHTHKHKHTHIQTHTHTHYHTQTHNTLTRYHGMLVCGRRWCSGRQSRAVRHPRAPAKAGSGGPGSGAPKPSSCCSLGTPHIPLVYRLPPTAAWTPRRRRPAQKRRTLGRVRSKTRIISTATGRRQVLRSMAGGFPCDAVLPSRAAGARPCCPDPACLGGDQGLSWSRLESSRVTAVTDPAPSPSESSHRP